MPKKTNCIVHGKPMYRLRAKIGIDINGNPVYKSFYGDGISEAKAKRDEFFACRERNPAADKNDSFGKLAQFYTYEILANESLAEGTVELYERQYRKKVSRSSLSMMPIQSVRRSDIQKFFNDLAKNNPSSVIKATSNYFKRLFKWLDREGYCHNLMAGVIVPKGNTQADKADEISVFSEEEVESITATENRLSFLFLLALSAGLRSGELRGLKYSDIKCGSVTVNRQLNEHYEIDRNEQTRVLQIKDVKSKSSRRTVPLPKATQDAFEKHRKWHREEMLRNGYRTDFIFTTRNGELIDPANFRRAWQRHLKKAGVPFRKFHSCRATYCTMLCKSGVPLETASKLMGHSDVSVTAKFYRMVGDQELRSAVDRINDLFQKPSGDKLATNE